MATNGGNYRLTEYDYSSSVVSGSNDGGTNETTTARRITESIQGNIVRVSYNVVKDFEKQEIVCVTGTNWNSSGIAISRMEGGYRLILFRNKGDRLY